MEISALSGSSELAGYISDDFGLIMDSETIGYSDKWLDKLIACYANSKISTGDL